MLKYCRMTKKLLSVAVGSSPAGRASHRLPQLYHTIQPARGKLRAIRRPGHAVGFSEKSEEMASRGGIPYLHSTIIAAGGYTRTIGRPGHTIDRIGVPLIHEKAFSAAGCPYLNDWILAHGSNARTV